MDVLLKNKEEISEAAIENIIDTGLIRLNEQYRISVENTQSSLHLLP